MSIRPHFFCVASTSVCSQASAFLLEIDTFAPARASSSAIDLPMPRVEPVTRATFPLRSNKSCIDQCAFHHVKFNTTKLTCDRVRQNIETRNDPLHLDKNPHRRGPWAHRN